MKRDEPSAAGIDLNADVGEGFSDDEALIRVVTSVNVACGAHAGDAATIRRTVELATAAGVAVGAHPSYPDREGFGRREMELRPSDVVETVVDQVRLVDDLARTAGARIGHVKPHGALYNRAARDPEVAAAVARAVGSVSRNLVLVGLAGSASLEAARAVGLRVAAEGFADRRYEPDGRLRDRRHPDAVLGDPVDVGKQAVALARDRRVRASDGSSIAITADTICIHGDLPGAAARALAVRAALDAAGIPVRRLT